MSRDQSHPSPDELIQNYLENEATPTEEKQFRLLLGDQSFRRRVAEHAIDLGHIHDHANRRLLEMAMVSQQKSSRRRLQRTFAAAILAVSILLPCAWFGFRGNETPVEQAERETVPSDSPHESLQQLAVARVVHTIGNVVIGDELPIMKGTELRSGDVLRTVDAESFALLEFRDKTVLTLAGETGLSCAIENTGKVINISSGNVMAQVSPQPAGRPMRLLTPVAEAEVLGTQLSLFADAISTELAVQEGQVLLRRFVDRQSVNIGGGEYAVAMAESELVARPIEPTPAVWDESFEKGLPDRWRVGRWVRSGLPKRSHGAVRAVEKQKNVGEQSQPRYIMAANEWRHGLFLIDRDSHLNFTYKVKQEGWFYVMVSTRTDEFIATVSGSFIYKNRDMWQVTPGEWHTRSIPLSMFQKPKQGHPDSEPQHGPRIGDVVFTMFFRTQEADPGLVIDRIWVTRGPAESAEIMTQ